MHPNWRGLDERPLYRRIRQSGGNLTATVLEGRFELPQPCGYSALNATCLPVPPLQLFIYQRAL
jgi:hypothetical protein